MRVERQSLREHLSVEDGGSSSAVPVVGDDEQIIRTRLDGQTRGPQVVAFLPAGQKHLADRDAVLVERQNPGLAVHGDIEIAVAVGAHRIRGRTSEVIGDGRTDRRDGCRVRQFDPMKEVSSKFGDPQFRSVRG